MQKRLVAQTNVEVGLTVMLTREADEQVAEVRSEIEIGAGEPRMGFVGDDDLKIAVRVLVGRIGRNGSGDCDS